MKKLTPYESTQEEKRKQLMKRIFIETVRERCKMKPKKTDIQKRPFLPNNFVPADSSKSLLSLQQLSSKQSQRRGKSSLFPSQIPSLIDAETGEALAVTSSTWNGFEGRVNLNSSSIVARGTGKLDILHGASSTASSPITSGSHPLVQQLRDNGPLTLRFHREWNPKTGTIRLPPLSLETGSQDNEAGYKLDEPISEINTLRQPDDRNSRSGDEGESDSDSDSDNDTHFEGSRLTELSISNPDAATSLGLQLEYASPVEWSSSPLPSAKAQHGPFSRDRETGSRNGSPITWLSGRHSPSSTHAGHQRLAHYEPLQIGQPGMEWASSVANWKALEDRYFKEIVDTVSSLERNKSLTHEKPLQMRVGSESVKLTCRRLSQLKAMGMYQIAQAVRDEELQEEKRVKQLSDCSAGSLRLAKLREDHQKERMDKRQYIESLQRDNEIIFLTKVAELEWLW